MESILTQNSYGKQGEEHEAVSVFFFIPKDLHVRCKVKMMTNQIILYPHPLFEGLSFTGQLVNGLELLVCKL